MDDSTPPVVYTRGRIVTIKDISEWTGYSYQTINGWITDGCPVQFHGDNANPTKLSFRDVLDWRDARHRQGARTGRPSNGVGNQASSKERALAAQADKRELELEQLRGELFYFRDFEPYIEDELVGLRTELLGIEEEVRERYGAEVAKDVRSMIVAGVNRYCDSLAEVPDKWAEADAA